MEIEEKPDRASRVVAGADAAQACRMGGPRPRDEQRCCRSPPASNFVC
jgi:hypothetical protein